MDEHEVRHVFANRLQAEHDHWNARVRAIVKCFSEQRRAKDGQRVEELRSQLHDLRNDLSKHVEEEAQGGFLEEAGCRCPRLSKEAERIEHKHPQLLAQLDEVIAGAWNRADSLGLVLKQANAELG